MAEKQAAKTQAPQVQLEGGTYEVIRNRLLAHGKELRKRLDTLNVERKEVFGSIETRLIGSERITTENNCIPRDMVPIGNRFLFGYNVFVGLRKETKLSDVFAVYEVAESGETRFQANGLDLLADDRFATDFANLYKYYKNTRFAKFAQRGPHLFMVFRIGDSVTDVKTFKWLCRDGSLQYLDNRSDHEYAFPPQHEFEWKRAHRDMHHAGLHPHVSIDDRIFVETMGGDLTVKIEDNTETGEGIYSEPVDNPDQTLDDAEILYAIVDNIILLKVRPYQEKRFRYLVYNEKVQKVVRIDAIEDSCVLLPDGHGLIFPNGYYLQTGEMKVFDNDMEDMIFEQRLAAPNGEDFLYLFYNRDSGTYLLLSYNLIEQKVATPIVCHGYSFFENGELAYFRAEENPQKYHVVQIWQTPYTGQEFRPPVRKESKLYKIGNKDIVRAMAECSELLNLLGKEESYANLYVDIVKKATEVTDHFFWLSSPDVGNLAEPLGEIRTAAAAAIDEFDKVVRVRRNTAEQFDRVSKTVRELIREITTGKFNEIGQFVGALTQLRTVRGEVIGLRELRYVDLEKVDALETEVQEHTDRLSGQAVEFLLTPESMQPYRRRVQEQAERIPQLTKGAEADKLNEDVTAAGAELEMLIDVVSNLKIADPTQTTEIIDRISEIYSQLNQVKSALKNRRRELLGTEAVAEFNSQIKLVNQGVVNYLDICDTPEKCDEYLTKVMAQMEGLESRFAEFDEFIVQIAEKREELYAAFESKKVQLTEARARRASSLMTAAQRMLKGIRNRADSFTEVNEINGYFASDLMVERVRETIRQLRDLGDSVKADDIQSQLKTLQEDSVRQLKDRKALYEDGDNVIRLGSHRFSVNRQPLELTIVHRDGEMFFHLTGTGFFEKIRDDRFLATKSVWHLDAPSETEAVYRALYLAWQLLKGLDRGEPATVEQFMELDDDKAIALIQQFMGPRYSEGYVKGVHDRDAMIILRALINLRQGTGLLRFASRARALGVLFWRSLADEAIRKQLAGRIRGVGMMSGVFPRADVRRRYVAELLALLAPLAEATGAFTADEAAEAAEYLFAELGHEGEFATSQAAHQAARAFERHLKDAKIADRYAAALGAVENPIHAWLVVLDWVQAFLQARPDVADAELAAEIASLLWDPQRDKRQLIKASVEMQLEGLSGSHPTIEQGRMALHYPHTAAALRHHECQVVPLYRQFIQVKKDLTEAMAHELRLEEFQPRVLSSFVRNQLIDKVYLPILGDNLAKQMGVVGAETRTDRMGLLLLISPPGYGKTTLMEYIANRLGLTFIKINGPAVGHRVTSLDPAEAPNASAREELEKLNLALEMGDNIMLYVDDIQHCNPEFLQKFISLCDAQRRIEGVYKGRTRTYDLRGKKVAVVMAGNPYTESGEKFRLPDMLTNRADTYNLGDILGDHEAEFILSFLENSLTSNPVLNNLATRSQPDVYAMVKLAEGGSREGLEFEHNYSAEEINEYVATLRKLIAARDVVLKVNAEYIRSAGMEDQYRTEPAFLLQGSYRNMNRIASKVLPVMNDRELWTVIESNYESDAQTLTKGAEANLLKFKELVGRLSEAEAERWDDIRRTFQKNQSFMGMDGQDKLSMVVRQLGTFGDGLQGIREVIAEAAGAEGGRRRKVKAEEARPAVAPEPVAAITSSLQAIQQAIGEAVGKIAAAPQAEAPQVTQALAATGERFDQFSRALGEIRGVLAGGLEKLTGGQAAQREQQIAEAVKQVSTFAEAVERVRSELSAELEQVNRQVAAIPAPQAVLPPSTTSKIEQIVQELHDTRDALGKSSDALERGPQSVAAVLEEQLETLEAWLKPGVRSAEDWRNYIAQLIRRFQVMVDGYGRLIAVLSKRKGELEQNIARARRNKAEGD